MWETSVSSYLQAETEALLEWAKCGESVWSSVPTVLWGVGMAALAHRLIAAIFRRFLFRRVPLWELILQHLLFLWLVIYSLHFWVLIVKVVKLSVNYCYDDTKGATQNSNRSLLQQWVVWMLAASPLAFYVHTRPKPERPPLMIWITTSPWQRREMGAYGYYLNRPLSSLQSSTNVSVKQVAAIRRTSSESKIAREPVKKKRHSKSV